MLPGMSDAVATGIGTVLLPSVTALTAAHFEQVNYHLMSARDEQAQALGVQMMGGPDLMVAVTDPERPVGDIRVQTGGTGNLLYLDNHRWNGSLTASIRLLGQDSAVLFNDIGDGGYVMLHDVFMRSHRQFLFWGQGATAVGCSIEVEGQDIGVAIGDDALISNGVWLRNYNMHALHDLRSGEAVGRPPASLVLERHVWLGQDSLLLNCGRVGTGAVVGARSLVTRPVPACTIVAGNPAEIRREAVSWGRDTYRMTAAERVAVGWPGAPGG
jgi:hypothetical protein